MPQMMSRIVTVCHTVYHGVTQCPQIHPRCTYVQKRCTTGDEVYDNNWNIGIYMRLSINKKAFCLIAEGCIFIVHITNWVSIAYAVLFLYLICLSAIVYPWFI